MAKNEPSDLIPSQGGMWQDFLLRVKLILRLMADGRVNPLLKLIPIGVTAYLIFPDLLIGPFEDVPIVLLGMYLFIELCPPEIVEEHVAVLTRSSIPNTARNSSGNPQPRQPKDDDDVVDADFREL